MIFDLATVYEELSQKPWLDLQDDAYSYHFDPEQHIMFAVSREKHLVLELKMRKVVNGHVHPLMSSIARTKISSKKSPAE